MLMTEQFAERTLNEIGEQSIRAESSNGVAPDLPETAWAVSKLTEEGLERVGLFLADLARRHPLGSSAFAAHRMVIEALEADLRRETARRIAKEGGE